MRPSLAGSCGSFLSWRRTRASTQSLWSIFSRDQFEIGVARTAQIVGHMAGEIVERLVWILLPNSVNNQNRCLLCLKNGFISHTPTLSLIGPVVFWAPGQTGSCRHQALFLLTLPAEYRVSVC